MFMDNDIEVDGVIGVSAGAIHGLSYVARQRGRNMRYNMKYRNNKHYMSLYSLLTTGDICGEQFCYHDIPEKLDPLDYDAFLCKSYEALCGCSNLDTGEAEYLECTDMRKPEDVNKVRASASLPLVSNIVEVDGMKAAGWRCIRQHTDICIQKDGLQEKYSSSDKTGGIPQGPGQDAQAGGRKVQGVP